MSIVEPVTPELLALMCVVPSPMPVATPPALIMATLGREADHDRPAVRSLLDPSLNWPLALKT